MHTADAGDEDIAVRLHGLVSFGDGGAVGRQASEGEGRGLDRGEMGRRFLDVAGGVDEVSDGSAGGQRRGAAKDAVALGGLGTERVGIPAGARRGDDALALPVRCSAAGRDDGAAAVSHDRDVKGDFGIEVLAAEEIAGHSLAEAGLLDGLSLWDAVEKLADESETERRARTGGSRSRLPFE